MKHAALLALAVGLTMLSARADVPNEPGLRRVYVGQGQALVVSAPRQLTLNAHVSQVLVQPGSLEAAYTSTVTNGDTVTQTVKLVGFRTGQTWTLLQSTSPNDADADAFAYKLVGWSNDGRYLLVSHLERTAPTDTAPETSACFFDSVDVGVEPFKIRRISLPGNSAETAIPEGAVQVSPSGNLLALPVEIADNGDAKAALPLLIYDVTRRSTRRVMLPAGFYLVGWDDETHLLLSHSKRHVFQYGLLDTATGTTVPITHARFIGSPPARAFPAVSLSLAEVPAALTAPPGKSTADARALWLTVKGENRSPKSVCLAVSLGGNGFSALLAPNQSAALWLERGELYVSTLSVDAATVRERYDNGDALTCDEERGIAESNVQQIGLALLQYSQDYDEQFPPAANFHDGITLYTEDKRLLQTGNVPFTYAPPTDLHLSAMGAPGYTIVGTFRLPCATVALFADGHQQTLPPSKRE